jgi:hypothetical protein
MRLRRIVCVAVAVALSATVGLATAKVAAHPAPRPDATPRLLVVDAAITPVVGRVNPSWGDGRADDRGPVSGLFAVLVESPHLADLLWIGVLLIATAAAWQRRSDLAHVRGPPLPELA